MNNTKQENTFQLVAYRYLAKCDFEDVVGIPTQDKGLPC